MDSINLNSSNIFWEDWKHISKKKYIGYMIIAISISEKLMLSYSNRSPKYSMRSISQILFLLREDNLLYRGLFRLSLSHSSSPSNDITNHHESLSVNPILELWANIEQKELWLIQNNIAEVVHYTAKSHHPNKHWK